MAEKFSVEGWKGDKSYVGQFGFHGGHVERIKPVDFHFKKDPEPLIISQFQGLGDILFSIPLIRSWINEGHKIIWPVISDYVSINKHFPEITFMEKSAIQVDYNRKQEYSVNGSRVIPLRWADGILRLPYKDVMKAKYMLYGEDWRKWWELSWKRDHAAEDRIFKMLGLRAGEKFNLVNKRFRTDQSGLVEVNPDNDYRCVEMVNIPGTTMLDWSKVIEAASEIHTVHTAVVYIIDVLETTDKLHQYLRKPDEKDFSFTDYLWKKEYQYHF